MQANAESTNDQFGFAGSVMDVFLPCLRRDKRRRGTDISLELESTTEFKRNKSKSSRRKATDRESTLGTELEVPFHLSDAPTSPSPSNASLTVSSTAQHTSRGRLENALSDKQSEETTRENGKETVLSVSDLLVELTDFSLDFEIGKCKG